MSDGFEYDVFLSHSAKDKVVVRDVAEWLRKDGVKVWSDEWVLKPGDNIPHKIEEGLERSRVLVLCMSAHAFGSDWAQFDPHLLLSRPAEQGAPLPPPCASTAQYSRRTPCALQCDRVKSNDINCYVSRACF